MSPANDNVEQAQTDISGDGPWKHVPRDQVRREFAAFRAASAYPEHFPGVAVGVRPRLDRATEVVCAFSVREQDRDGERAPCNICNNRRKFVSDGRLIVDSAGWLFFVGPDCASTYFSDGSFARSERQFQIREEAERSTKFLFESLPQVRRWRALAVELLPFAAEAEDAHKKMLRDGSQFRETVLASYREGALTVVRGHQVQRANGKTFTRRLQHDVARIVGTVALQSRCEISPLLANGADHLQIFEVEEDDGLELLCKFESEQRLTQARQIVSGGIESIRKARDLIVQHRAFYTEENFSAIGRWVRDPDGPRMFEVTANGKVRTIRVGEDRFWMRFTRLLERVPAY